MLGNGSLRPQPNSIMDNNFDGNNVTQSSQQGQADSTKTSFPNSQAQHSMNGNSNGGRVDGRGVGSQYILSPEGQTSQAALATHV